MAFFQNKSIMSRGKGEPRLKIMNLYQLFHNRSLYLILDEVWSWLLELRASDKRHNKKHIQTFPSIEISKTKSAFPSIKTHNFILQTSLFLT